MRLEVDTFIFGLKVFDTARGYSADLNKTVVNDQSYMTLVFFQFILAFWQHLHRKDAEKSVQSPNNFSPKNEVRIIKTTYQMSVGKENSVNTSINKKTTDAFMLL